MVGRLVLVRGKTMRGAAGLAMLLAMAGGGFAGAQTGAGPGGRTPGVVYRSGTSLEMLGRELLKTAGTKETGSVSAPLDRYATHYTNLVSRVKSGGGEVHKKAADVFVVMDGEATVITGGTIVAPKDLGDEIRGTGIEGGVPQVLHKGDVLMIPANTPHQTRMEPGKTFTYFVVKVVAP